MDVTIEDAADKVRGALVRANLKFSEQPDHRAFRVGFGSSLFFIDIYPMPEFDDVVVEAYSLVLSEMELTDELISQIDEELNRRNAVGKFGCLWLHRDNGAIVLEHHLWASCMNGDELTKTLYLNAERSDRLDDEFKQLFKTGSRWTDRATDGSEGALET